MTVEQIQRLQDSANRKFDLAAHIRTLLNEFLADYKEDDRGEIEEEILAMVTDDE